MRLPMLITAPAGPATPDRVVWRVAEVDTRPAPPGAFRIHDAGYVRNDAHGDISDD